MADQFKTPMNQTRRTAAPSALRSAAIKRDSLAAELEKDPQLSTAKRQQRQQVFTSTLSHASLERQLLAAQTAKMELETKLRESELQVERLERDRQWFADREKEEREERERESAEHDEAKRKADTEIRTLRSGLSLLREELADLQDTHTSSTRSSAHTISSQKSTITSLTHQVALLESELAQFKHVAEQRASVIADLQNQVDDLTAGVGDASVMSIRQEEEEGDMRIVREELKRQQEYVRGLEKENNKLGKEVKVLRERQANVEILREEKLGLERKLGRMDELRKEVVRLEAEVEAGRKEREEWATKSTSSSSSLPSISTTQTISSLRLAHASLLETHGSTLALLRQRETQLEEYERREAELTERLRDVEAKLKEMEERAKRRDVEKALAEREVGFLQAMLASYTAEEQHLDPSIQIDETKAQRIEQLETLVAEYKSAFEELQAAVDAGQFGSPNTGGETRLSLAELEEELERERKEQLTQSTTTAEAHLSKIDELEQTLFELQGEIAGGRHVPPNTRVLSMKDNPEEQWFALRQAALDRLKEENAALLKRLKELEEAAPSSFSASTSTNPNPNLSPDSETNPNALIPLASYTLLQTENTSLLTQLAQKEKRFLRLRQVYLSKTSEFREAIASILGMKLAFYPNGQVRATSVYDLSATFVFQPTGSGGSSSGGGEEQGMKMQLIGSGEEASEDLLDMVHYWVGEKQCIPGFLASVTLECYDKMNRCGGGGGGGDGES